MKKRLIVFDMDGTIADLYGVNGWLDMLFKEDTTPYEKAKPLYPIEEINEILRELKKQNYKVCITTWLSKNGSKEYNKRVTQAKLEWLQKNNFEFDYFNCVEYGTPKEKVTGIYNYETQIIFDDDENVRKAWNLGVAINPLDYNIIEILKGL